MSDQQTPQTPVESGSPEEIQMSAPAGARAAGATTYARPASGRPPMNPYLAGFYLGLTLLGCFLILGAGLGASGGFARLAAWAEHLAVPGRVEASPYFGQWFPGPMGNYLVYMILGVFGGGAYSALTSGRFALTAERGPTFPRSRRLLLALGGGAVSGFAARLAQGCTSGQGLTGGALLLTGSLVFMACLFATGYLTAWMFGRQWK